MAARFFVGGGSSANWAAVTPTNWSATSGGAGNQTVPGSLDDVTFDGAGATGNSASTIAAIITIKSLTFAAGYTQTVTCNAVCTIGGNFTDNTAHAWAGASNITIGAAGASPTITSGGKTFPNGVSFTGTSTTKTLVGNWTIGGALTVSASGQVLNWTTAETLSCAGITMTANMSGTAKIILTGGTWSGANPVQNDMDIAGNVTVSGAVGFNTKTLTYVSGTVTTTGSTLGISGSTTLNTNGITWNNVTLGTNSSVYTLNSLFSASGTVVVTTNVTPITFAGTAGFTIGTLTAAHTSVSTFTFANGVTYIITTAINVFSSRAGAKVLFTSDHASLRAIFILQNASTTCNLLADFTRIDASAGRPIISFNGTITDCINVISQTNVIYKPIQQYNRGGRRFNLTNSNKTVLYQ